MVITIVSIGLTGCTLKTFEQSISQDFADSISGSIENFGSLSLSINASSSCAGQNVQLFSLNAQGKKNALIASSAVGANGKFTISDLRSRGLTVPVSGFLSTQYLLEFSCGDTNYQRFVSGPDSQNLNQVTTLVAWVSQTDASTHIISQPSETWTKFYQGLKLAGDFTSAYSTLISTPQLSSLYQSTFGIVPEALLDAPPKILTAQVPTTFAEESSQSITAESSHWSADYETAYRWKIGNLVVSNTANFNFTPTANMQGPKTLQLFVGQDDGSGDVDTSKAYVQKTFPINIDNTSPAVVPTVTLASPVYTNSLTASLTINTGSMIDGRPQYCKSFSGLALIEDTYPALSPPPLLSGSYTIDCTDAGSQLVNVTLDGTEGSRVLRLWARDASGNISTASRDTLVVLDRTAPALVLNSLNGGQILAGGSPATLTWSGSDANPKTNPIAILYSTDAGTNWTSISLNEANDGSYIWTLPSINSNQVRVRLKMTDLASNETTVTSLTNFTIDSISPSAPTLIRTSAAFSSSATVALEVTCTSDDSAIFLSETSTTPAATAIGWQACSSSMNYVVGSLDGPKTIYAWSKDLAGNVSATATTVTMTLDQTAPLIAISSTGPMKGNSLTGNATWTVTESNVGASTNFIFEIFDGTAWVATATPAAVPGSNSGRVYSLSNFSVPFANAANARIRVQLTDAAGNTTTTQSNVFTIDSIPPLLQSLNINDNAVSTGLPFINMKASVTDNLSLVSHLRFAETSSGSNCQTLYADTGWVPYVNGTTPIGFAIAAVDGTKKICAWAKDQVGNVSTITGVGSLGVDAQTIDYFVGNPPVITSFSVTNSTGGTSFTAGDSVYINWTISDVEGLSNSPVSLSVSVNGGAYTQIVSGYGSLTGFPTTYSFSYSSFAAPAGVFRIKIIASDANGNTSNPVISNVMNGGAWSVYMGTSDSGIGGSANGVSLYKATFGISGNQFAVNPVNGDIYAVSYLRGIIKLSASTGVTSTFLTHNSSNFVDGMSLGTLRGNTNNMAINFDSGGRLYISNPEGIETAYSVKIWQVDLENNKIHLYAGGGTEPGLSGSPPTSAANASILYGAYDIDNQNSMYVFSSCDPSTYSAGTLSLQYRILKIAQNSDGTAGAVSIFAGNCSPSDPVAGADAVSTGLGTARYGHIRQIAVNADGTLVYVTESGVNPATYKIVNVAGVNKVYHTAIGGRGLVFDRVHDQLFTGNGDVRRVTFATDRTLVETSTVFVSSAGTGDCNSDGTLATASCINSYGSNGWAPLEMANDGSLLFTDVQFRIRYLDSNNKLRTLMGTKPFFGDGLHRTLARGLFAGMYYKSNAVNTTDFPIGLYFLEQDGGILGHVDPTTNNVTIIAGNQLYNSLPANGTAMTKFSGMGGAAQGSYLTGLTFDSNGYPIFIAGGYLVRIGAGRTIQRIGGGGSTRHTDAADNVASNSVNLSYDWGGQNFIAIGVNYVLGIMRTSNTLYGSLTAGVGMIDLSTSKWRVLMNGSSSSSQPAAPDSATPTTVNTTALSGDCFGLKCQAQYNSADSMVYIAEGNVLRTLANPTNPSAVTLSSPASLNMGRAIRAFNFSPDNNRIYYLSTDGKLYCKWIGVAAAPTNCSNTSLGPGTGFSISTTVTIPNRIVFPADGTILIGNSREILQYEYAP